MSARVRYGLAPLSTLAIIGLMAVRPAPLAAEDPADAILLEKARTTLQQQVGAARQFVSGLNPSREQARRLLAFIDRASALRADALEDQAGRLTEMLEAFGEFEREDSLNQGFTRSVERRTARVNHQAKETRERFVEQMLALEKRATAVLTEEQRAFARQFRSGKRPAARTARARRVAFRRNASRNRRAEPPRRDRLADARRELNARRRVTYPQLGPIGKHLLHPAAGEVLCKLGGTQPSQAMRRAAALLQNGTDDCPISVFERQKAEVATLRGKINNWNLINGLHLSGEQTKQIAVASDRFDAGRKAAPNRRARRRSRQARAPAGPNRAALERAVEQILSPGQLKVLEDYKSCLIPPKNLKNPVRVGQANDSSRFETWLTRARRMPQRRLQEHIEATIDREAEHFGGMSEDERQARAALLRKTARDAAGMSATEFELDKADLAERITPQNPIETLTKEISHLSRQRGLGGPVARFMLKRTFIDQLKLRGRQLADGVVSEPADLAGGPQAENCEKGCAIKPKGKKNPPRSRGRRTP